MNVPERKMNTIGMMDVQSRLRNEMFTLVTVIHFDLFGLCALGVCNRRCEISSHAQPLRWQVCLVVTGAESALLVANFICFRSAKRLR